MKNGLNNKNKYKFIIVLCLCMFCLCGYAIWETVPKLINADKPFIDLQASTDGAIGSAETAFNLLQEKEVVTPTPEITAIPTPEPTAIPQNLIEVRVGNEESDTIVIIGENHFVIEDTEKISKTLTEETDKGKTIRLTDDFAEKEAFKTVIGLCSKLDPDFEMFDESGMKYE